MQKWLRFSRRVHDEASVYGGDIYKPFTAYVGRGIQGESLPATIRLGPRIFRHLPGTKAAKDLLIRELFPDLTFQDLSSGAFGHFIHDYEFFGHLEG